MITMPYCTHTLCMECFKGHFKIIIKEKEAKHFNCPICYKPDMSNNDEIQKMHEQLFVEMINQYLGSDMCKVCKEKLEEYNFIKHPDHIWCANDKCGSSFHKGNGTHPQDIQCPKCRKLMCQKCKKPWKLQHMGYSCEQFAQSECDNNLELQELGLAAHLNNNGIECPVCHAHYELAKGGCMHFKCTRCPSEFCSGCKETFKKREECGKFSSCIWKDLHAHHPRDCLFYLRKHSVNELQAFLKENKKEFSTKAPTEQIKAAKKKKRNMKEGSNNDEEQDNDAIELHCLARVRMESVGGVKDQICGKTVEDGHAGLCEIHYKEYLVSIINKHSLDPITIYETYKVKEILIREEIAIPEQKDDEDNQQYRERLIQYVQEHFYLTGGRNPTNPVFN